MRRLIAPLFGLLVLSACTVAEMNPPKHDIRFDCQVDTDALVHGSLILRCIASNNSTHPIQFLPWNTPLESRIRGRFFDVKTEQGEELEYRGLLVKRAAPQDADYLTLNVGESVENSVDLTNSYSFCANSSYQINYSSIQVNGDKNPVTLWMPSMSFTTSNAFDGCQPKL